MRRSVWHTRGPMVRGIRQFVAIAASLVAALIGAWATAGYPPATRDLGQAEQRAFVDALRPLREQLTVEDQIGVVSEASGLHVKYLPWTRLELAPASVVEGVCPLHLAVFDDAELLASHLLACGGRIEQRLAPNVVLIRVGS